MLKMDNAEVINIHMQGGAMGNLSSAIFEGEQKSLRELARSEKKLWAFNGEIGGYDHACRSGFRQNCRIKGLERYTMATRDASPRTSFLG